MFEKCGIFLGVEGEGAHVALVGVGLEVVHQDVINHLAGGNILTLCVESIWNMYENTGSILKNTRSKPKNTD